MTGRRLARVLTLALLAGGCGSELDVGSDLIWTARFESNDFREYTSVPNGSVSAVPSGSSSVVVSSERAHTGSAGAKMTVDTTGQQLQNVGLALSGDLPIEAYYSAWYYLPRSVTVGPYWVIFKFRMRTDAANPSTTDELFDVDLDNLPTGEMTLRLFDHRSGGDLPLDVPSPVVPVGDWFQVEGFYRNTTDQSGRLILWVDGRQIIDLHQPMAPTPWVAWDVSSIAPDLTPASAIVHIDDCAVSRARVGPDGILAR
jgi:hypothetical protein